VESTLFGHEKGAFTGATRQAAGVFESADGGTVFLDEIGELPPSAQASLLRVLESGRFSRVGSTREVTVDVRVVAATHRDLEGMCSEGTFREDLLYRLNAMIVEIPPLRDRPEDIEPLIARFLAQSNRANERDVHGLDAAALDHMLRYPWPGNVRELRNAVERAVVICEGERIGIEDLPLALQRSPGPTAAGSSAVGQTTVELAGDGVPLKERVALYEAQVIREAYEACQHSRIRTAQKLGVAVRTLSHKMQQYGIRRPADDRCD